MRFNIYYSSPYYYLYDGDDTGEEMYRTCDKKEILQKQKELEERHLNEKTD